eukprot:scaffold149719_cov32-Tisochrysis_lutea.AAC.4
MDPHYALNGPHAPCILRKVYLGSWVGDDGLEMRKRNPRDPARVRRRVHKRTVPNVAHKYLRWDFGASPRRRAHDQFVGVQSWMVKPFAHLRTTKQDSSKSALHGSSGPRIKRHQMARPCSATYHQCIRCRILVGDIPENRPWHSER